MTLFVIDASINWVTNRNWQTNELDMWEVTQLNIPCEKSVKIDSSWNHIYFSLTSLAERNNQ